MTIHSQNPATGERIQTYSLHTPEACEAALTQCQSAWIQWKKTSFDLRKSCLLKLSSRLKENQDAYARLMAEEMGKPITQGLQEVNKCAWVCEYYANNGTHFLADTPVETEAAETTITHQPLGIILAIMPWNFPFWQVLRAAAPALTAGNAMILKHASNVPGCAKAIEALFKDSGFPEGLFTSLLVDIPQTENLIKDPRIQGVTMTGSTEAGRRVAALTGRLLKKTVMELGGSDPYIILEDADLDLAAEACATSRMINAGQSCIAAKRLIAVESIREAFEQKLLERLARYTPGNPLSEETNLGPLARTDLRDALHAQVTQSIKMGAQCLLGGTLPRGPGSFYPATLLTQVKAPMPAYTEELFGPVATIISACDETEAIKIANDTPFGLGGALFTQDIEKGRRIATESIEAGSCAVNTFVQSDPRLPFGGIKDSGFGRELGKCGILEFTNTKSILIQQ